jgi:hypothetical protein
MSIVTLVVLHSEKIVRMNVNVYRCEDFKPATLEKCIIFLMLDSNTKA